MQLLGRLEIKSKQRIREFLNEEHVGRIASIDDSGFPQIIPMNFVYLDDAIYMHSHTRGEKIDNVRQNNKVGFEVDRELEFLPSYFEDPKNASLADTLYISVVIKGKAVIVNDKDEKVLALNGLMGKYQPEGHYESLNSSMEVLNEVAVIKVIPDSIRGKYKIGQGLQKGRRMELAQKILNRNSPTAKETLKIMGFEVTESGLVMVDEPVW
ncbi:MAG: pyridoxamine 5'-phosphate oxidase family protein [Crenarchaeota archaeon]|nr:MAG: pyridoxamine 5'-phosphate oxidase family protein [Thermoproteota archaeon]RDJ32865.1 MAG: pyridoxamine 5'-phosphate oxidase family protein [Thermoproteota archaeon]RDJ38034.1 MAG: pyridoxamine 5'-phosphate oxidase family protein [Thermoproteota archaeon]RDJ38301.1 MAG: pyridoxamine 5'-phosphate oxidase family protein [Thermoproteota archaeon]